MLFKTVIGTDITPNIRSAIDTFAKNMLVTVLKFLNFAMAIKTIMFSPTMGKNRIPYRSGPKTAFGVTLTAE